MSTRGDLYYGNSQNRHGEYVENRYLIAHNAHPETIALMIENIQSREVEEQWFGFDSTLINNLISLQPNMFYLDNTDKEGGYTYRINDDAKTIKCEYSLGSSCELIFDGKITDFVTVIKEKEYNYQQSARIFDSIKYGTLDDLRENIALCNQFSDSFLLDGESLFESAIQTLNSEKIMLLLQSKMEITHPEIKKHKELLLDLVKHNKIEEAKYFLKDYMSPVQCKIKSTKLSQLKPLKKMKEVFKNNQSNENFLIEICDSFDTLASRLHTVSNINDFRFNLEEIEKINNNFSRVSTALASMKRHIADKNYKCIDAKDLFADLEKIYKCKTEIEAHLDKKGFIVSRFKSLVDIENLNSLHQKIQNNEEIPSSEFSKIDFESKVFNSLDDDVKEAITEYVTARSDAINADALEKDKQQSTLTDLNV